MKEKGTFLFSVDLEDVRSMIPGGDRYKEKVPAMTEVFLNWLNGLKMKATFFIVGQIVETYPELVHKIAEQGHEIASHSHRHLHVTELGKDGFKRDLEQNLTAFRNIGIEKITGFRAPTFSLTQETPWAYEVLDELGFSYSSSVLPAANPLFGWSGFGRKPKKMGNITEIPMAVSSVVGKQIAFSGGVYLRVLPFSFTLKQFRKYKKQGLAVPSYIHPYDIDTTQEHFMHPHLNDSKFYNYLMYRNRDKVMTRLQRIVDDGFNIMTYQQYADKLTHQNGI